MIMKQRLTIRDDVLNWPGIPIGDGTVRCGNFPFPRVNWKSTDFMMWMKSIKHLADVTRDQYEDSIGKLIGLLECHDDYGVINEKSLMHNLWMQGLMEKLVGLEILKEEYSWTRHIVIAMQHYAKHLKLYFSQKDDNAHIAITKLDAIVDAVLAPKISRIHDVVWGSCM